MRKASIGVLIALCFILLVGAGCAKKRTDSTPPGATDVSVKDDSQMNDGSVDEAALAAEAAKAQQEAMAMLSSVTIHFAFDSYELSEEARSILAAKANIMRQYQKISVVVEGHCDERGTEEYNLALGEHRARAAFDHLVILGVAPERMSIVSYGEERPVDGGHTEAAWAQNRRAEFVVR